MSLDMNHESNDLLTAADIAWKTKLEKSLFEHLKSSSNCQKKINVKQFIEKFQNFIKNDKIQIIKKKFILILNENEFLYEEKEKDEYFDYQNIELLQTPIIITINIYDEQKKLKENFYFIKTSFERIFNNLEGKILLKINSYFKKFSFNFYFFEFTEEIFAYESDDIINIFMPNSKTNDDSEVICSIAQESCHYAHFMVFRNQGKPYGIDDETNEIRFQGIITECLLLSPIEPIIGSVFDNYEKEHWATELAIRIPHLLYYYQKDQRKLFVLKEKFRNSFNYYEQVVMPAMKASLPVFEKLSNKSMNIKYDDLTEALKSAIKNFKVEFQGKFVKLKEISNENILQNINMKQIRKILNNKKISLGKTLDVQNNYKERKFVNIISKIQYSTNDLLNLESNRSKIFVLSDHAGAGKSKTMKCLANEINEKFPQYWIVFIELKRYLEIFKKYENENFHDNHENLTKFLIEILGLETNLEILIFEFLFTIDKVVLIFDGFDEIAPKFEKFILHLIIMIKNLTKNLQWIATRPQHEKTLKHTLGFKILIFKLQSFDVLEGQDFMKEYMKHKSFLYEDEKVQKFIEDFKIYENPLMLKILADLHIRNYFSFKNVNCYSIYEAIMEKKKVILAEKGPIANFDTTIDSKMNIWEIHQIYALKMIFKDEKFLDCYDKYIFNETLKNHNKKVYNFKDFQLFKLWKREKSKWTPDAISRFGFLTVDNWNTDKENPQFVHRTFAEFFVAKFLIENVKEALEYSDDLSDLEFDLNMKFAFFIILMEIKTGKFKLLFDFIFDFIENEKNLKNSFNLSEKSLIFLASYGYKKFIKNILHYHEKKDFSLIFDMKNDISNVSELYKLLFQVIKKVKIKKEQSDKNLEILKAEKIAYEHFLIDKDIKIEPEENYEIELENVYVEEDENESSKSSKEENCSFQVVEKDKSEDELRQKTFKCKICSIIFENSLQFNRHQRIHQPARFKCATCLKMFKRKSSLTKHKCDIIVSEKNLSSTSETVQKFIIDNAGSSNDLKCKYCKKIFSRSYLLTQHEILHKNPEYFRCEICKKSFRGKFSLDNHKKNIHSNPDKERRHMRLMEGIYGDDDDDSSNWHKCQICPSSFRNETALQKHVKIHSISHRKIYRSNTKKLVKYKNNSNIF